MRLVEIARLENGVEDGYAALQEGRCITRAFDLTNRPWVQPGGKPEVTLGRSSGNVLQLTAYRRLDDRCAREHTVPREPLDKRIRVLIIGIVPRHAMQPEGLTARGRQSGIPSIHDV